MDASRWARVRGILERVDELPPLERGAALAADCGDDDTLRAEVEALLAAGSVSLALSRIAGGAGASRRAAEVLAQDLVGGAIGGFRLERVVGAGGMGVVFAARQESPRRTVAVKLTAAALSSPLARRRFEVEGEVLALLQHPSIAQVFASGLHALDLGGGPLELPWIAMEFVDSARTLTEHAEVERLDLGARLALFRAVCSAVQHAHGRSVIHRDLKPGNVLVGADGRPRVIDFGIARVLRAAEETRLTGGSELVGTPLYMAPEQVRGEEVDIRCDVYALGAILYELVAGVPAHDLSGKPLPLAYRLLAEQAPRPPTRVRPDLPRELDWIVERAMEPDRDLRYPSVLALDEDLGRLLRHEPVLAGPGGFAYRARKYVRRHRLGVAAAAGLALLGASTLATYAFGAARTSREHERMLRLADSRALAQLRAEEAQLYPAYPHVASRMREWLARVEPLEPRLALHRADLAVARERDAPEGFSAEDAAAFEHLQSAWWLAALTDLVADMEDFFEPRAGLVARVRARLRDAETVRARTVEGPEARARWQAAAAAIADREVCPLYGGLTLAPQIGLLPLGRDPDSGLWEFLLEPNGSEPPRDADGHLVPEAAAGIVFVLVPGGAFVPRYIPVVDRPLEHFEEVERPPRTLEPCFLSKWELTQAQWRRLCGEEPSVLQGDLQPVESVSWVDADLALRRAGLELPTSDLWVHAMLAGHDGPWWFDELPADLPQAFGIGGSRHVQVGSFPPNPFGLHDLLGNVQEWLQDAASAGERRYRDGSYAHHADTFAVFTRASWEPQADPREAYAIRGVRAMRRLDSLPP